MASEVALFRELVKKYWSGQPVECPKHSGVTMTGSFVQTTFADHVFLACSRGKETFQIPQRPKQIEFQNQQVEGLVENIQRGDQNLCYRCQSKMETEADENPTTGYTDYIFTCVRCFSYGQWSGHPDTAKIGSAPTAGTRKKKA